MENLSDSIMAALETVWQEEEAREFNAEQRRKYAADMAEYDFFAPGTASVNDVIIEADEGKTTMMEALEAGRLDGLLKALKEIQEFEQGEIYQYYADNVAEDEFEWLVKTLNPDCGLLGVFALLEFYSCLKYLYPSAPALFDAWKARQPEPRKPHEDEFYFDIFLTAEESGLITTGNPDTEVPTRTRSVIPERFYTPNSKLWNDLPDYVLRANNERIKSNSAIAINVNPSNKKSCEILVTSTYDAEVFTYSDKLDEYDKLINAAFATLVYAGNRFITAEMVYRTMNGLTDSERVDPAAVQEIERRIDRQRKIEIKIDARQQLEMWKPDRVKGLEAYYSDFLIVAGKGECILNGIRRVGYYPHSIPVVFSYSNGIGQIHSAPLDLLDVKKVTKGGRPSVVSHKKSMTRTLINHYILNRIKVMQDKNNHVSNRRIKMTSIYEAAGTNTRSSAGRANMQRAREIAFEALDYYVSKGEIKGYKTDGGKTQKGGHKAYTYIDIIL